MNGGNFDLAEGLVSSRYIKQVTLLCMEEVLVPGRLDER